MDSNEITFITIFLLFELFRESLFALLVRFVFAMEDRIECFLDTSGGEQEFNLHGISATDRMKQMVVDFYA